MNRIQLPRLQNRLQKEKNRSVGTDFGLRIFTIPEVFLPKFTQSGAGKDGLCHSREGNLADVEESHYRFGMYG